MGVLTAGQAQAFVVTVNSLKYDVTTFNGTYNANTSQFATAANGGVMPWWGSSSLASQFATTVGTSLGNPNFSSSLGPYFAYSQTGSQIQYWRTNSMGSTQNVTNIFNNTIMTNTWAIASLAPVTGPLPALGAAAAFGLSRKLRKRIKINKGSSATYTPI